MYLHTATNADLSPPVDTIATLDPIVEDGPVPMSDADADALTRSISNPKSTTEANVSDKDVPEISITQDAGLAQETDTKKDRKDSHDSWKTEQFFEPVYGQTLGPKKSHQPSKSVPSMASEQVKVVAMKRNVPDQRPVPVATDVTQAEPMQRSVSDQPPAAAAITTAAPLAETMQRFVSDQPPAAVATVTTQTEHKSVVPVATAPAFVPAAAHKQQATPQKAPAPQRNMSQQFNGPQRFQGPQMSHQGAMMHQQSPPHAAPFDQGQMMQPPAYVGPQMNFQVPQMQGPPGAWPHGGMQIVYPPMGPPGAFAHQLPQQGPGGPPNAQQTFMGPPQFMDQSFPPQNPQQQMLMGPQLGGQPMYQPNGYVFNPQQQQTSFQHGNNNGGFRNSKGKGNHNGKNNGNNGNSNGRRYSMNTNQGQNSPPRKVRDDEIHGPVFAMTKPRKQSNAANNGGPLKPMDNKRTGNGGHAMDNRGKCNNPPTANYEDTFADCQCSRCEHANSSVFIAGIDVPANYDSEKLTFALESFFARWNASGRAPSVTLKGPNAQNTKRCAMIRLESPATAVTCVKDCGGVSHVTKGSLEIPGVGHRLYIAYPLYSKNYVPREKTYNGNYSMGSRRESMHSNYHSRPSDNFRPGAPGPMGPPPSGMGFPAHHNNGNGAHGNPLWRPSGGSHDMAPPAFEGGRGRGGDHRPSFNQGRLWSPHDEAVPQPSGILRSPGPMMSELRTAPQQALYQKLTEHPNLPKEDWRSKPPSEEALSPKGDCAIISSSESSKGKPTAKGDAATKDNVVVRLPSPLNFINAVVARSETISPVEAFKSTEYIPGVVDSSPPAEPESPTDNQMDVVDFGTVIRKKDSAQRRLPSSWVVETGSLAKELPHVEGDLATIQVSGMDSDNKQAEVPASTPKKQEMAPLAVPAVEHHKSDETTQGNKPKSNKKKDTPPPPKTEQKPDEMAQDNNKPKFRKGKNKAQHSRVPSNAPSVVPSVASGPSNTTDSRGPSPAMQHNPPVDGAQPAKKKAKSKKKRAPATDQNDGQTAGSGSQQQVVSDKGSPLKQKHEDGSHGDRQGYRNDAGGSLRLSKKRPMPVNDQQVVMKDSVSKVDVTSVPMILETPAESSDPLAKVSPDANLFSTQKFQIDQMRKTETQLAPPPKYSNPSGLRMNTTKDTSNHQRVGSFPPGFDPYPRPAPSRRSPSPVLPQDDPFSPKKGEATPADWIKTESVKKIAPTGVTASGAATPEVSTPSPSPKKDKPTKVKTKLNPSARPFTAPSSPALSTFSQGSHYVAPQHTAHDAYHAKNPSQASVDRRYVTPAEQITKAETSPPGPPTKEKKGPKTGPAPNRNGHGHGKKQKGPKPPALNSKDAFPSLPGGLPGPAAQGAAWNKVANSKKGGEKGVDAGNSGGAGQRRASHAEKHQKEVEAPVVGDERKGG